MVKDKKKTLTISSNLKKKIDTSNIQSSSKKAFSVEKKKPFRNNKPQNKFGSSQKVNFTQDTKRKNFERKFIEQQATKDFIKKDSKPVGKSKLKLKSPVDRRDFKWSGNKTLSKVDLSEMPNYLTKNYEKYSNWIED